MEKNIPVEIKAELQTSFYQDDSLGYNVIAEIPGYDRKLKKEIVMLGAHLDSWHAGTGATDNASGCAVVMEAVRILKSIDVKPRRTIRIALWDGEEQEYYGSRGYIKNHFGDAGTMQLKPDHDNFSVYFNLDNGAGKIRGIYLQNNDSARPIFEAWLRPFHDLDATTVTIRETTGTDHIPFNEIGLPAFQFIQDELDYDTRTHHTNMDVYEHVLAGDVMQASAIMASFVYHAAMRDEKIPRKPLPAKKELNDSD
jgi:Zn-dependent M28 family amino/carboxypeptidase